MNTKIKLTFTQCKQIKNNGYNLREFVEQVNDQPDFMSGSMGIGSISELQAIIMSGCASNAHQSVFYHEAMQCMNNYGDDVLEYIEYFYEEIPQPECGSSWSQIASFYLVTAIELWCGGFSNRLERVDWD